MQLLLHNIVYATCLEGHKRQQHWIHQKTLAVRQLSGSKAAEGSCTLVRALLRAVALPASSKAYHSLSRKAARLTATLELPDSN